MQAGDQPRNAVYDAEAYPEVYQRDNATHRNGDRAPPVCFGKRAVFRFMNGNKGIGIGINALLRVQRGGNRLFRFGKRFVGSTCFERIFEYAAPRYFVFLFLFYR